MIEYTTTRRDYYYTPTPHPHTQESDTTMYFDNDEDYTFVRISDEECEVYDKVLYAVGEIVTVGESVLKWDFRLWHPNTKIEHLINEQYLVFEKRPTNKKPLRGNIHLRTYLYDVVKVDDPRIEYKDLGSYQLTKLNK